MIADDDADRAGHTGASHRHHDGAVGQRDANARVLVNGTFEHLCHDALGRHRYEPTAGGYAKPPCLVRRGGLLARRGTAEICPSAATG